MGLWDFLKGVVGAAAGVPPAEAGAAPAAGAAAGTAETIDALGGAEIGDKARAAVADEPGIKDYVMAGLAETKTGKRIVGGMDFAADVAGLAGADGGGLRGVADTVSGKTLEERRPKKKKPIKQEPVDPTDKKKKTLFDRRNEEVYGGDGGIYGSL